MNLEFEHVECIGCGATRRLIHLLYDKTGLYNGHSYCRPCLVQAIYEKRDQLLEGKGF